MTRKEKEVMHSLIIEAAMKLKSDGFVIWAIRHMTSARQCWMHNDNCSEEDRAWRCIIAALKHLVRRAAKLELGMYRFKKCVVLFNSDGVLKVSFEDKKLFVNTVVEILVYMDQYLETKRKKNIRIL